MRKYYNYIFHCKVINVDTGEIFYEDAIMVDNTDDGMAKLEAKNIFLDNMERRNIRRNTFNAKYEYDLIEKVLN